MRKSTAVGMASINYQEPSSSAGFVVQECKKRVLSQEGYGIAYGVLLMVHQCCHSLVFMQFLGFQMH